MDREMIIGRLALSEMLFDLLVASSMIIEFFPELDYDFPPDFPMVKKILSEVQEIAKNEDAEQNADLADITLDFWYGRKNEILSKLNILDIRNQSAGRTLSKFCLPLMQPWEIPLDMWPELSLPEPPDDAKEFSLKDIEFIRFVVNARANEFLGYWTAKMEEKKRNLRSAQSKTKKVLAKKKSLRELLKEHPEGDRSLILEAMSRLRLGERRIKDLLKEIKMEQKS